MAQTEASSSEPGPKRPARIRIPTWVGLGLVAAFAVLTFLESVTLRWYVMVPLAVAAALLIVFQLLRTGRGRRIERLVLLVAAGVLLFFFLWRDIALTKLAKKHHDEFFRTDLQEQGAPDANRLYADARRAATHPCIALPSVR